MTRRGAQIVFGIHAVLSFVGMCGNIPWLYLFTFVTGILLYAAVRDGVQPVAKAIPESAQPAA